jgi:transposase
VREHPTVQGEARVVQTVYDWAKDLPTQKIKDPVGLAISESRTGCQWDFLPNDLPPRSAVYYYFAKWRDDGTDQTIHDLLRWQVREKRGRLADPSLVVLDTPSVHAAAGVPTATRGRDPAKRVPGRKRGLAVDVLGLVIAVVVLAASAHDNAAGTAQLDRVAAQADTVEKALVDQGFKNAVVAHGAGLGIDVEIIERNPSDQGKGFVPQPKRWVVLRCWWVGWAVVWSGGSSGPGMACGWLLAMARSTWPPGATRRLDR